MTTKPVVVGADGSPQSLRAVEWAASEARRHGAPLRIISVPVLPPRMRPDISSTRTVADVIRDESAAWLDAAVARSKEIAPELPLDTSLLSGAPAQVLTDCGVGALMLVVGASSTSGLASMLLGSVSRYVAQHATCPVVVVGQEKSTGHRKVAVGVSDRHDAAATLAFAFDEAALRQADLLVIHSSADEEVPAWLTDWYEKYPGVTVSQQVCQGHPARVLASHSASADLLVIGRHGAPHPADVGGIQRAVLSHARGPVAVVPAED
ncbi:universal stress protein [Trebonia kvetii]|uniref:Universal stress protein n=1 Tax=Trebonia kvetii TaxID=2480626 RepID=A0A6P2C701_9ACTN|nr:universal stress protein [Trebonia kvetii]TVZ05303.1 universal stress protein [Trebonia kvetii]